MIDVKERTKLIRFEEVPEDRDWQELLNYRNSYYNREGYIYEPKLSKSPMSNGGLIVTYQMVISPKVAA